MSETDSEVYARFVAYCKRIGMSTPPPPEVYFKVTSGHNPVVNYGVPMKQYAGRERVGQ